MEFKFRAVDDRPLSYPSPLTVVNHSDQAPRVKFQTGQNFPRTFNLFMTGLPNVSTSGFPRNDLQIIPTPLGNPDEARQLEEARIREEIIAVEIARRRALEAEVRQQIMYLEREMAMRRVTSEEFGFEDRRGVTPFGPRMPSLQYPFDEKLAPPFSRFLAFDGSPMVRRPDPIAPEIKAISEPNKDKLIVLAKPDPTLSGVKRKEATMPTVSSNELHPFGIKKRPKEAWSCAICQVSATSEKVFNEHIQGRKHKAKEARLRAEKAGKGFSDAPLAKKTRNPFKFTGTRGCAKLASVAEVVESIQNIENGNDSDKKKDTGDYKVKDKELPMQKDQNTEKFNKENGAEMVPKLETTAPKKMKQFKLWCEMCQVGAYSSTVMEAHKKGKKHLSRIGVRALNGATILTTADKDATPMENDLDVSKTAKIFENVGEEVKNVNIQAKEMENVEDALNKVKTVEDACKEVQTVNSVGKELKSF